MAAGVQSGAAIEGLLYIEASTNPRSGSCIGHFGRLRLISNMAYVRQR